MIASPEVMSYVALSERGRHGRQMRWLGVAPRRAPAVPCCILALPCCAAPAVADDGHSLCRCACTSACLSALISRFVTLATILLLWLLLLVHAGREAALAQPLPYPTIYSWSDPDPRFCGDLFASSSILSASACFRLHWSSYRPYYTGSAYGEMLMVHYGFQWSYDETTCP